MPTSGSQIAKDARKFAELGLAGLIVAAQAVIFVVVVTYFLHG